MKCDKTPPRVFPWPFALRLKEKLTNHALGSSRRPFVILRPDFLMAQKENNYCLPNTDKEYSFDLDNQLNIL